MNIFLLLFVIGISGFSYLLYTILLKFSENVGIRNEEVLSRWSTASKPALGGIVFYISFLLSFITYILTSDGEVLQKDSMLIGLLITTTLAFMMGLADDAYNTKPLLKLGIQFICGIILFKSGIYIPAFQSDFANLILTVFWIVGIMNAINLLDNMDGISTITSAFIILFTLGLILLSHGQDTPQFLLLLGVFISLLVFLIFNWSPSKMFMGDTGSQFLGLLIGIISIQYIWNFESNTNGFLLWKSLYLTPVIFSLPIIDTTVVFTNRILKGQSPFIGGKDHTSHHLSYLGLKDGQVGLVYILISIINILIVFYAILFVDKWTIWHGMIYGLYFTLLLVFFFYITRRKIITHE